MKETYFFYHDYGARNDPKLQEILMDIGPAGIGIFWCLLEMLYEQGGYLPYSSLKSIAYNLHTSTDEVNKVINDYGLFAITNPIDGEQVQLYSPTVQARLEERRLLSEKRAKAGKVGGMRGKQNTTIAQQNPEPPEQVLDDCEANVKQVLDDCEAIKGNKIIVNKNKENENKENSYSSTSISEEEKEHFLSIFIFEKNWLTAKYEVERFINYYNGNGWMLKSGMPVADKIAVCRQWKPERSDLRHKDKEALQWLHIAYEKARENGEVATELISSVPEMMSKREDKTLQLYYRCSNGAAELIKKYISITGVNLHFVPIENK